MSTITLKDEQWTKIVKFLRTCPRVYVGQEDQCRRFIEGVLWIARSGSQWRLLPEQYGHWNSVYKRFARWSDHDVWPKMHQHFADDPDMEHLILDSTIVRAHPCAAGALKKDGSQAEQALGRSKGGFSTKIHVSVDGLGNPLRFILTAGQRNDITQAEALIVDLEFDRLIADKGYDADDFIKLIIEEYEAEAVIPPRAKRKERRDYDVPLYKERHLVECFINKIKHYRRIFSRFEKLASRYLSFLSFVGTLIWLR
jgi:transposase